MGIGFYFSSSYDDVENNYDDLNGQDLENRIDLYAEQLQGNNDISYEDAIKQSTRELSGGENIILETYLSVQNPIVIGGKKETYFNYIQEYDEESDEYGEESGLIVDFFESFNYASAGYYYVDANRVFEGIEIYDGIGANDLIKALKTNDALSYSMNDEGKLALNEIIRSTFEGMGFDAIIDNTVKRFNMDGIYEDTQHIIAFKPNQIKSVHAESFCHETNINKSLKIN